MTYAEECRERAAKARRMAAAIATPNDPAIAALLELAAEWEEKAAQAEATAKESDRNADDQPDL
jgi:hypothetical protein